MHAFIESWQGIHLTQENPGLNDNKAEGKGRESGDMYAVHEVHFHYI